jgi:hypothetical protein
MYVINRAVVVSTCTIKDPRLTVRILSLMDEITDVNVLPKYPSFFKNKIINFPVGSFVWVITTDDFYLGYVLGESNIFTEDATKYIQLNTRITDLNKETTKIGAGFLDSTSLNFLYVDNNVIEAIDTSNGIKFTYNSSGSLSLQSDRGIFFKFGNSFFSISNDEILIKSKSISLSGKVQMGTKSGGRYVLGSSSPNVSYKIGDGAVLISTGDVVI